MVGVGVIVVLVWRGISHIHNILIQCQTASSCMLSVERLEAYLSLEKLVAAIHICNNNEYTEHVQGSAASNK